jgi:ADP-ribose pyrophosphatase
MELPAGTLETDEQPERCARRELREESAFEAEHVEHLLSSFAAPGTSTEVMDAFLATGLSAVGQQLEPDEEISVELVDVATLHQRCSTMVESSMARRSPFSATTC